MLPEFIPVSSSSIFGEAICGLLMSLIFESVFCRPGQVLRVNTLAMTSSRDPVAPRPPQTVSLFS